jgi:hypothetical protein
VIAFERKNLVSRDGEIDAALLQAEARFVQISINGHAMIFPLS